MEAYAKNLPINELIAELDAYMVKLGYTKSSLRHYRQAWNALKNLTYQKGEKFFSKEIGFELLREHYNVEPYDLNLSEYKSDVRRSVMLLLEYQISGTIAKRMPHYDEPFPVCFSEIGKRYICSLQDDLHLRASTIHNQERFLTKAFIFFEAHNITEVAAIDVKAINTYLKTFAGLSKSYIGENVNALKAFFSYAFDYGVISEEMQFPKVSVYKDRKIPEYYTPDEIQRILGAVDRANPLGKRNYAMILLAARYGFRISDVLTLKFSHLDFENNCIRIVQKKTDKLLVLDLLPDVGWAIIDYIKN
jgi:integrase/recombinase XerD